MSKHNAISNRYLQVILHAVLASSLLMAGTCASAQALQDDWSGAYGGIDVGYMAGDDEATEIDGERFYIAEPQGATGSLHLGWQKQFGSLVAGVEAEAGYTDAASFVTSDVTGGTITSGVELGAFGTLSAKLGIVPADGWLLFGKIGAAVGEVDASTVQSCTGADLCGGAQSGSVSSAVGGETSWGLMLGAGVERRFGERLSGRISYQFTDYSTELVLPETDGPGWDHEIDQHSLRLGVSYRF